MFLVRWAKNKDRAVISMVEVPPCSWTVWKWSLFFTLHVSVWQIKTLVYHELRRSTDNVSVLFTQSFVFILLFSDWTLHQWALWEFIYQEPVCLVSDLNSGMWYQINSWNKNRECLFSPADITSSQHKQCGCLVSWKMTTQLSVPKASTIHGHLMA